MINCDVSSSVHHYIDSTEEHFSPSEHALGSEIELYTCVFILVSFCLVEPILSFSCAIPAAAPSPINVRLSEKEGSRRRLLCCEGPAMRL